MNTTPQTATTKKTLFILRNSPYGSARAQEGVEAVMAASVFEQQLTVLFMDEGVWQLHSHQQSRGVVDESTLARNPDRKNIAAQIESFPLYDINTIYVDRKALKRFGLPASELILEPELVGNKAICELIAAHDVVLTF